MAKAGPARALRIATIALMVAQAATALAAPAAPATKPDAPAAEAEAPPTKPDATCFLSRLDRGWPRHVCIRRSAYDADVCRAIRLYADQTGLPRGFFARLVWQESRFDRNAVSPAGAQGIAQFMPTTARLRGLADAYNPAEALARSAEYLAFLREKFGNLGLAAAAYNAGEARVSNAISADGSLPGETEAYVRIVTGYPVASWMEAGAPTRDFRLSKTDDFHKACLALAKTRGPTPLEGPPQAPWKPWGVQLAADYSPANARRIFEMVEKRYRSVLGNEAPMLVRARNPKFGPKPRYHARIGRDTRQAAEALCGKLRAAGGACIVVKN